MDKLIIREMREDDIPAVWEIERASFSAPWFRDSFLIEMFDKQTISKVAVFQDSVVGYIFAHFERHESSVMKLAVRPDFRRRGVATRLMHEAMGELKHKGCVFMYLKVRESDNGAKSFYDRLGFKVQMIRKKYYDNPDENALLMMGRL